jgi:hypothetical protein
VPLPKGFQAFLAGVWSDGIGINLKEGMWKIMLSGEKIFRKRFPAGDRDFANRNWKFRP